MAKKIFLLIFVLALTTLGSCKKCRKEDPRARVINNGTQSVSVQVMTTGGNTININNINANSSSDFKSYAPGTVTFTISIGNKNNVVKTVEMEYCYEYDIAIDANNNVVSTPTER